MKKTILFFSGMLLCIFSSVGMADLMGVEDAIVEKNTGAKGAQFKEMLKQYKVMTDQLSTEITTAENLVKETKALGNFQNPDSIKTLLDDINNKIHQSQNIAYDLSVLLGSGGTDDFYKNYPGYRSASDINKNVGSLQGSGKGEYKDFYIANSNRTLSTINDSNAAIEEDNDKSNGANIRINSTIDNVPGEIAVAEGTTQAVSILSEVNIQVLRQLQSMHAQLAAMAESQNAAAAKKIQEDSTATAEYNQVLDLDASEPVLKNGDNEMPPPKFST